MLKVRLFGLVFIAIAAACVSSHALRAQETVEDSNGTLNPQALTLDYAARQIDREPFNPTLCLYGYAAAKMGDHVTARHIFKRCAEKGILAAMPWMAWTEENGYDKPSDPEKAAQWDRRAAEAGYSIGEFNYGLDLLRGHGVRQDLRLGKNYIDRAARHGDATAANLAQHGYDPEWVTPDADRARYHTPMY